MVYEFELHHNVVEWIKIICCEKREGVDDHSTNNQLVQENSLRL